MPKRASESQQLRAIRPGEILARVRLHTRAVDQLLTQIIQRAESAKPETIDDLLISYLEKEKAK